MPADCRKPKADWLVLDDLWPELCNTDTSTAGWGFQTRSDNLTAAGCRIHSADLRRERQTSSKPHLMWVVSPFLKSHKHVNKGEKSKSNTFQSRQESEQLFQWRKDTITIDRKLDGRSERPPFVWMVKNTSAESDSESLRQWHSGSFFLPWSSGDTMSGMQRPFLASVNFILHILEKTCSSTSGPD